MDQTRELSPEEMNRVSGGHDAEVRNGYNTGDVPGSENPDLVCHKSPDGKHGWSYNEPGIKRCRYCNMRKETKPIEIF